MDTSSTYKINWRQKLTSRKFWVSLVGFITLLLIAFGLTDHQATQISAIIMSGAQFIAYIIGEGIIDASRVSCTGSTENETIVDEEHKE